MPQEQSSGAPSRARQPGKTIRFGAYEFCLDTQELYKHGRRLRVQAKPLHILSVLLSRPGELVTREELRHELGPKAKDVNVVAISVDPKGDTKQTVEKFLGERDLKGRMDYLIGDASQLGPVWESWNVGSEAEASNPELIAHTALVYGISSSGKLVTIYPANFKPSQIVHDLPKLEQL